MGDFPILDQSNGRSNNRDIIRTRNSIIEEIFFDRNTAYVTISYGVLGDFDITHMELVRLIVSNDTIIRDSYGRNLRASDLREGMTVDADFSSAMTFSIPPQARAYRIIVRDRNESFNVTVGSVLMIDPSNGFLYTGNANNIQSQMRFVITDSTAIFDRNGRRIPLRNLRRGQRVRIEHATFQTPSIPPQTTAFVVRVI